MKTTLLEVFTEEFKNVKFDKNLAKRLYRFQLDYINSRSDHLKFFGGNLIGVHVIRFTDTNVNDFFNEVVGIDRHKLEEKLSEVDDIYQDNSIISDSYNLTCMYIIHRYMNTIDCKADVAHRARYDAALLFFIRSIAALMSYFFKYPTDEKIAQVAYANLNNKYLIKKLGSWNKVLDYRANDLISNESVHFKTFKRFDNDLAIAYAVSDSKDRIKDIIKNYTAEFYKVHESGESIGTTSSVFSDGNGEKAVKETSNNIDYILQRMRSIISDQHVFVNDAHVSIIVQINKNTSFRMLKVVLTNMSSAYFGPHGKEIDEFITMVIVYNNFLLDDKGLSGSKDYPKMLTELKNLYLSTRSEDVELQKIRDVGMRVIDRASDVKMSKALGLATRTAVILYLALRSFSL